MFKLKVLTLYWWLRLSVFCLIFLFILNGCISQNKSDLGKITNYDLKLEIQPESHNLVVSTRFNWYSSAADTLYFLLNSNLRIDSVNFSGTGVEPIKYPADINLSAKFKDINSEQDLSYLTLYGIVFSASQGEHIIDMHYTGFIYDSVRVAEFSRWAIADETTGIIDSLGAFLTPWTGFYPRLPGVNPPAIFHSEIFMPEEWKAVAEGHLVVEETGRALYDSEHPLDGTYICAGPYQKASREYDNFEVSMYYYSGSEMLTERYIDASANYIRKYNKLLGEYAFDRFSVVENWFPTGYGMPSYTLLGSEVIRLPFIIYSSLGHEVCHNWWGNGVLVDYETGNWCEGLTTYCADYLYKSEKSEEDARQYRMEINRDYSEYIIRGEESDFALKDFTERTTPGSRTIGYGKSMMVFHMLKNTLGEDIFWKSLRNIYDDKKFQYISWDDFFAEFQENSSIKSEKFQEQWINNPGAPYLRMTNVKTRKKRNQWLVEFDVIQKQERTFSLDIPVTIVYHDSSESEHILRDVFNSIYHARILINKEAEFVKLDPDYELFRVLDIKETVPTLAGFFATEDPLIVIQDTSSELAKSYSKFAHTLNSKNEIRTTDINNITKENLETENLLYLGSTGKLIRNNQGYWVLNNQVIKGKNLAIVYAFRDSANPSKTHLSVWAESPGAMESLARKLPHYGKYSYLAFSDGKNVLKGCWPVENSPLVVRVQEQ